DTSRCRSALERRAPKGEPPEARVLADVPGLFSPVAHRRMAADSHPPRRAALPDANRPAGLRQAADVGEPARARPRPRVLPPAAELAAWHRRGERPLRARRR